MRKEVMDPPFFARWQEVLFTSLLLCFYFFRWFVGEFAKGSLCDSATKAGAPFIQREILKRNRHAVLILSPRCCGQHPYPYLQKN